MAEKRAKARRSWGCSSKARSFIPGIAVDTLLSLASGAAGRPLAGGSALYVGRACGPTGASPERDHVRDLTLLDLTRELDQLRVQIRITVRAPRASRRPVQRQAVSARSKGRTNEDLESIRGPPPRWLARQALLPGAASARRRNGRSDGKQPGASDLPSTTRRPFARHHRAMHHSSTGLPLAVASILTPSIRALYGSGSRAR